MKGRVQLVRLFRTFSASPTERLQRGPTFARGRKCYFGNICGIRFFDFLEHFQRRPKNEFNADQLLRVTEHVTLETFLNLFAAKMFEIVVNMSKHFFFDVRIILKCIF